MQAQGTLGSRPFVKAKVHISFSNVTVYGAVPPPPPSLMSTLPSPLPFPPTAQPFPPMLPLQPPRIPNKRLRSRPCLCHGKLCPARSCPPLTLSPTPRALMEETLSRDEQTGSPCLRLEENFLHFYPVPQTGGPGMGNLFSSRLGSKQDGGVPLLPRVPVSLLPPPSPPTSLSCSLACQNSLPHS